MTKVVERAYRYRFYPTKDQEESLAQTFGCCRWTYNHFLALKSEKWLEEKKNLKYVECSRILTELKEEYPWLKEVSSVTLQQTLRHLDRAFTNFFKKKARYPSFKKRHYQQSATYMKNAFTYENGEIKLAKHKEPLKIRWSRQFEGEPSSVTVTKESMGRYYISFIVKEEVQSLPFVKKEVGLDLGITHTIKDNNGHATNNPKYLENDLKKLKQLQRSLSRKKRNSKNFVKTRKKIARLHMRIRDKRKDFLHKLSRKVINENQVIAIESLKVKKMIKNKRLSRAIADAGWGTFVRFLEYKSDWYGRNLVRVDTYFPSSKRCSSCGHILDSLDLKTRNWECPACQTLHDRDTNAARNILSEGLRLLAETVEKVPWDARDLKPVEFV